MDPACAERGSRGPNSARRSSPHAGKRLAVWRVPSAGREPAAGATVRSGTVTRAASHLAARRCSTVCEMGVRRKEVGQGATDERKDALGPGRLPVGDKMVSQTEEINDHGV